MLLLSTYCMFSFHWWICQPITMLNRMMLEIAATYMAGSEGGRISFLYSQVFFHKLSAMAGSEGAEQPSYLARYSFINYLLCLALRAAGYPSHIARYTCVKYLI